MQFLHHKNWFWKIKNVFQSSFENDKSETPEHALKILD